MTNLSRRQLLGQAAAASIAVAAPTVAHAVASTAKSRPNILCIVSEDNNPFIGAYGDKLARTPNIDALAKRGLLYRNVYCNAPVCAPSRFGILTGVLPESCAPAQHMRAMAKPPSMLRGYPEYLREVGYYCTNNDKTDYNCDIDPKKIWDDASNLADWRTRPIDKPFLSVFNLMSTHESRLIRPTDGKVKPDDVRVPAYLPDNTDIRIDIASYYNLMEKMDAELGERLAKLAADGLADDTIIIYYSDNGGALPRSKRYCYEEGLRCAMVVYIPPKYRYLSTHRAGSEISSLVSFIDLAPTLLSIAGIKRPAHMQGSAFLGAMPAPLKKYAFSMRNRMDERYDMVRSVSDGRHRYIRNYMPNRAWGQHMSFAWLTKGYQSWESAYKNATLNAHQARFFQAKPFEELYDVEQDRDQLNNLAGNDKYRAKLSQLRSALDKHMHAINDNGFIPEGSPLEGYTQSRVKNAYPLKRIMSLASAAARRDPRKASLFQHALTDPNEVVRFWAAQGLLMLGNNARPQISNLHLALKNDSSPQVRIVVAEALALLGDAAEPVAELIRLLDQSTLMPVQLMALNALTFIGDAATPAVAAITRASQHENLYLRSAARYLLVSLDGTYKPDYPVFELGRLLKMMRENPTKFSQ
jgi:arylsulfatase A-like enzyme